MKKYMKGVFLVFLLLFCTSGCALLVAGGASIGGAVTYMSGWMKANYNVSLEKAYTATLQASNELDLEIENKSRTLSTAEILSKDGDRSVWIELDAENAYVTTISVKVGLTGDQVASEKIHNAISNILKQ